ncbi:hypothetical protein GS501_05430 [Saccharibacter sp. 17.LH.SD]|uniref:hypothetical protein n=1 Tax=Saccharibacter sp. 17.LH.SD TaxID=2689393 RepID=UPI00136ACF13|nr:hypothetical protein [Saccharibacter sp. 17.LH.SD]MXV44489.1 hypothetical protein [Saccharibacter sp. 17.LH.SD]
MKSYFFILLAGLPLLASCSSSPRGWQDDRYSVPMDVGRSVFDLGHMAQAERKYNEAFKRALAADDARAIHDSGYNLATSQLRQNHLADCLKTLDRVSSALNDRHWPEQADLNLIRASALYRQRQWSGSLYAARQVLTDKDKESHQQAYFFIGLDAVALDQATVLQEAISHLEGDHHAAVQANLMELQTHQFLMNHQWGQAVTMAQSLSKARQEFNDYDAMRRALALQKTAYTEQGDMMSAQHIQRQIDDSRVNE